MTSQMRRYRFAAPAADVWAAAHRAIPESGWKLLMSPPDVIELAVPVEAGMAAKITLKVAETGLGVEETDLDIMASTLAVISANKRLLDYIAKIHNHVQGKIEPKSDGPSIQIRTGDGAKLTGVIVGNNNEQKIITIEGIAALPPEFARVADLAQELRQALPGLSMARDVREDLEGHVADLQAQVEQPDPNCKKVRTALRSVGHILESLSLSVAGNAITAPILAHLHEILPLFSNLGG